MSFIHATETFYKFKEQETTLEKSKNIYEHKWIYDADDLENLHSLEDEAPLARLAEMGGIQGLAYALRTDTTKGLGDDEVEDETALTTRQEKFGINKISRRPPTPLYQLALEELEDPMLKVLIVAGIVSIIVGAIEHPKNGWIDGFAILLAVVVVVFVGAFNNFQKEKQFRAMELESDKKDCICLRAGKETEVPFSDVVVGDLVVLRAGYMVPCDGVFVLGTENMKTSEAALTGESEHIPKDRFHPFFCKGTQVMAGEGLMIATNVGRRTEWGKLMEGLDKEREPTPLQTKLERLGGLIGIGGGGVAILLFIILIIRWGAFDKAPDPAKNVVSFFIIAVTIVVVAVPEGLPLAVTISLAYSMKKMIIDNNFVRHHQACETMGNATTICSDKTGTLTQNIMSVTKVFISGTEYYDELPSKTSLGAEVHDLVTKAIICNSKAFYKVTEDPVEKEMIASGKKKPKLVGGNQTECALLQWAIDLGTSDYKGLRKKFPVTKFFPFDSAVKRSSVLVRSKDPSVYRVYTKGAAEWILNICSTYVDESGQLQELNEAAIERIRGAMDHMTRTGLRCLGICYSEVQKSSIEFQSGGTIREETTTDWFRDMTWICVSGIQDPVRPEVPSAVRICQRAGIVVRMVTGDHLETAKHIARECHILALDHHVCMTGKEFRALDESKKSELLPKLRVLARSKPSDKEALVRWYKEKNGDVVAVTGDGANDALALSEADVGLAMGIQGTDVAKEASDIIIMDDNFASIVKTVMWGRSVYDNIRKFVQFQLTVNVVALTLSLVGAFFKKFQNPLTAVQLLWVNLIMDTMAALALATEPPSMSLLDRNPYVKDGSLISKVLWRFIFGHSAVQLTILLITMFAGMSILDIPDRDSLEDEDGRNKVHLSVIFNTFVWLQIFNEINARRVQNEWNVFAGVFDNSYFVGIIVITVILQVLIVEFGGSFTHTHPLNAKQWGYCVGMGAISVVANQFIRLIPVDMSDGVLEVDNDALFGDLDDDSNGKGGTGASQAQGSLQVVTSTA